METLRRDLQPAERRAAPDGAFIFQPSGNGVLVTRVAPCGRSDAAWLQGEDAEQARRAFTILSRFTAGIFPVKPPPDPLEGGE